MGVVLHLDQGMPSTVAAKRWNRKAGAQNLALSSFVVRQISFHPCVDHRVPGRVCSSDAMITLIDKRHGFYAMLDGEIESIKHVDCKLVYGRADRDIRFS